MYTLFITKIQKSPTPLYKYVVKDATDKVLNNVTDITIRIDPTSTDCPEICFNQAGEEWAGRVNIVQAFRIAKSYGKGTP
jgi:hypothetical protein